MDKEVEIKINEKHIEAMKLLGETENIEFLHILVNYFQAKIHYETSCRELEKIAKKE